MEITTLCAVVAVLKVAPNRSQFFKYESVSLLCEHQGNSSRWTIWRNTSTNKNEESCPPWSQKNESNCFISDLYPSDSGVYWCESAAGECSNTINITVTAGSVILESPALPVEEREAVTLTCTNRKASSSNVSSDFYKDGLFIGSSPTGNVTIYNVSKLDEGFYKCSISGAGQSPDSWLCIREARHPGASESHVASILLPVVALCVLSALVLLLLCLWRSHKGKSSCDVSYIDVTITQEGQRARDEAAHAVETFYSTLKLETT